MEHSRWARDGVIAADRHRPTDGPGIPPQRGARPIGSAPAQSRNSILVSAAAWSRSGPRFVHSRVIGLQPVIKPTPPCQAEGGGQPGLLTHGRLRQPRQDSLPDAPDAACTISAADPSQDHLTPRSQASPTRSARVGIPALQAAGLCPTACVARGPVPRSASPATGSAVPGNSAEHLLLALDAPSFR